MCRVSLIIINNLWMSQMFVHYKRHNYTFTSRIKRQGLQCVCVCVCVFAFTVSSSILYHTRATRLAFIIFRRLFLLFNVLSDVKNLPVHLDDLVLVLVHVLVPVPVLVRMVFGLILVLDLALARALCSDRHNTYTSHVSQLSYFNAALHTSLYLRVQFTTNVSFILFMNTKERWNIYICLSHSISFNDSANRCISCTKAHKHKEIGTQQVQKHDYAIIINM